jgi:hypothetical protein
MNINAFDKFDEGNKRTLKWTTLNPRALHELWEMHFTADSWNARCRSFVLEYLGDDVGFKRGSVAQDPIGDFAELYKSVWKPLVTHIYDCIQVMGVCPVTFRRANPVDENSELIPIIPHHGTYVIQVAYMIELEKTLYRVLRPKSLFFDSKRSIVDEESFDNDGQSGRFYAKDITFYGVNIPSEHEKFAMGGGRQSNMFSRSLAEAYGYGDSGVPNDMILDRNTVVLTGFGHDPTPTGRLKTRLASLIEDRRFVDLHAQIMAQNQMSIMSRPLFFQENKASNEMLAQLSKGFKAGEYRSDGTQDRSSSGSEANGFNRNPEGIAALAELVARYHGQTLAPGGDGPCKKYNDTGALSGALEGAAVYSKPVASIPGGYTLPPGQRDDSVLGQRYFDLRSMLDDSIAGAYGIPLPLLRHMGLRGMEDQMMQHFHREEKTMASNISRVLTFCYQAIYGRLEREWSMAEKLEPDFNKYINAQIIENNTNEWIGNGGSMTRIKHRDMTFENPEGGSKNKRGKKRSRGKDVESGDEIEVSSSEEDEESDEEDHIPSEVADDELDYLDPDPEQTAAKNSVGKSAGSSEGDDEKFKAVKASSSSKKKSKKKSKSSSAGKKKQRTSSNSSQNVGSKPSYVPMEVMLKTSSSMMVSLLQFAFENDALTEDEFRGSLRSQIDFDVTSEVLKTLKKEVKERAEREKPKPKDAAGKSASGAKKKTGAGKGSNQTQSAKPKAASTRKGNEKRSMQARKTQTNNAASGRVANASASSRTKRQQGKAGPGGKK